jgi:hypothetical protein
MEEEAAPRSFSLEGGENEKGGFVQSDDPPFFYAIK